MFSRISLCTTVVALALSVSGCYQLTPGGVNATAGAPAPAQVKEISIPYEAGVPKFVVAVEELNTATSLTVFTDNQAKAVPIATQLTAQLKTALSNVGNISLLDTHGLQRKGDGTYGARLDKGELGPYVIRGTITEFNESAEGGSSSRGASLGGAGAVMGIAGAIADKPGLMWTGAGLAAANPSFGTAKAARKGMVAMDIEIVNGKTGRIVKSLKAEGTFASEAVSSGMSLFGIGGHESQFQESAIGQAMRAALNDASEKIYNSLKSTR